MFSSPDLSIVAAHDLIAALQSPHPDSPISPLSEIKVDALKIKAEIFKSTFEEAHDGEDEELLASMPTISLPSDNQPAKKFPA